ncbi:MAG: chromosome partitioning protein ParB, partial [Candidatus Nanopelagicaceae bacterium]
HRIVTEGLSVRAIEEIIAISKPSTKKSGKSSKKSSPELKELADQIGDALDTRVRIESAGGKGEIIIEYAGAEDLQRLFKLISSARS